MILAHQHETKYQIIRAQDASESEVHAVAELRYFLGRITGADFPVRAEDEAPLVTRPKRHLTQRCLPEKEWFIYVGDVSFGQRMGYAPSRTLGKEGFSIKTEGDRLYIIGGRPRGVLYGVYTFLETWCGCRWFTETISRIPTRCTLDLPEIDDTQVPVLEYREPHYPTYSSADWHARNKCNGHYALMGRAHGGQVRYQPFVHTFEEILNADECFDEHPEYFSEVDGKRCHERTQLCLTNPDVLEIAKKKVRQWIEENPDASIISVSQNDWKNYCTCAKCRKIDEREGSHMGTVLSFVNAIADDIRKDYPHIAIDTLAYQYTRKAPKTLRPRDNVIIRLCTIECCFAHPLAECDTHFQRFDSSDQTFSEDLRDWAKICNRLYVWDYVVNFHHNLLPHPNWAVLQPNIQFLTQNHVVGIFEQGNSFRGKYGEFDEMKMYVLAKLLWDPNGNMDVHVNEFLHGVYGAAAGEVRRYYDLLQNQITPDMHVWIYENPDAAYLTDAFLQEADACLARAELAADSEETLKRVKILRLSTRYALLWRIPLDEPSREEVLDAFYHDVTEAGIDTFYWRQMPEKAMEYLRAGDMKFVNKP